MFSANGAPLVRGSCRAVEISSAKECFSNSDVLEQSATTSTNGWLCAQAGITHDSRLREALGLTYFYV